MYPLFAEVFTCLDQCCTARSKQRWKRCTLVARSIYPSHRPTERWVVCP